MRIALVVNPNASSTTPTTAGEVEATLGEHHRVRTLRTHGRDDATRLTLAALDEGVDAVAVLGGDGTLNEVANPLVGTRTPLMALPGGGTNVFCRTIGLPDDPVAAAQQLVRAHSQGGVQRLGVGTVEEVGPECRDRRHFLFHTGVGWDAALVEVVERHAPLKRRLGHALFAYAGVRTFFGGYDRRRPHFELELDDGTLVPDLYFAVVMNSDPYTFVGHRPFVIDPGNHAAAPFTVIALRSMRFGHFVPVVLRALGGGGLRDGGHLLLRRGVESVTLRRTTSLPYQVDGDHLGDTAELRLSYSPDAISVVVPSARQAR